MANASTHLNWSVRVRNRSSKRQLPSPDALKGSEGNFTILWMDEIEAGLRKGLVATETRHVLPGAVEKRPALMLIDLKDDVNIVDHADRASPSRASSAALPARMRLPARKRFVRLRQRSLRCISAAARSAFASPKSLPQKAAQSTRSSALNGGEK